MNERFKKSLQYALQKIHQSEICQYVSDVYLYGSVARNEEKVESDIDLLVILDTDMDIHRSLIHLRGDCSPDDYMLPEVDMHFIQKSNFINRTDLYIQIIKQEGYSIWNSSEPTMTLQTMTADTF